VFVTLCVVEHWLASVQMLVIERDGQLCVCCAEHILGEIVFIAVVYRSANNAVTKPQNFLVECLNLQH